MKKYCIIVFLFSALVVNAQDDIKENKKTAQEIAFEKELSKKKARKETLKREVEELRKLLVAEKNQKKI